jgi:hypothetical protein
VNRLIYLLFLIIFGLFAYLLAINTPFSPDPVDLLPGDTLVVVETTALPRILAPWRQGTMSIETLLHNRLSDLKEFAGTAAQIAELYQFASVAGQMADAPFFERLFAGKTVLALLPDYAKRPLDAETVSANLVLLVHLHNDFAEIPLLENSFGSGPAEVSLYQGKSLYSLPLASGETLTIWQHRRVLVAALDPAPVRRCIDGVLDRIVRPRTSGLRFNRGYQEFKYRAGAQTDFFLYIDLEALRGHVANAWLNERDQQGGSPNQVAVFHRIDAGNNHLTLVARLCPEQIAALMTTYRLAAPVANPISGRLPADNLLVFWTNWFSPQLLLALIPRSQRYETGRRILSLDQPPVERTGRAGTAFFDVFGDRFGVFVDQESFAGSKQSVVGLFLEVRDRKLAEVVVHHFLAGLPKQTVSTNDMEIVSLDMANGLFQPSYLLKDTVLLIADNPDLMQQMLQRWQKMVDRERMDIGVNGRPVNLFLTFQSGKLIADLHSMLAVVRKKAEDQPLIMSARARLLLGHLVIPLFSGVQAMEVCTLHASVDGGEILVEMDWTLDRDNSH